MRKIGWWLKSFWQKQKKLILSGGLIGITVIVIFRNLLPLLPRFRPGVSVGIVGQYTLNTLPPKISRTLGRGLFQINPEGQVEPDLAESVTVNNEETIYQIRLRPGLVWNDNRPLVATDLEFDLPDVTVNYPDEATIEFRLPQPYAPFLTLLTRPVFKNQTTGSGEYSIKALNWQGQWLKRLKLLGPDRNLEYKFYLSHQAAWLGFRLGEVDRLENLIINPLDANWARRVSLKSRLNQQAYLAILFNLDDPNLANKSLRQSLAYSIRQKSPDGSSRALTPLAPDSWAYNPNVKAYDYNANQAKELFAKFVEESGNEAQPELILGTSASFLDQAETIARDWEETLDIKVNVQSLNSLEPGWQAVLAAQEIPPDPDQHALWHSTQPTNITRYSDLKVDKLLEDGRQISDPRRRREIYQDFQRFLVEDSPGIFLYHPTVYTVSRQGFEP